MGIQKVTIKVLRALLPDLVEKENSTIAYDPRRDRSLEFQQSIQDPQSRVHEYDLCLRTIRAVILECLDEQQLRYVKERNIFGVRQLFPYFIKQEEIERSRARNVEPDYRPNNGQREVYAQDSRLPRRRIGHRTRSPRGKDALHRNPDEDGSDPTDLSSIIDDLEERLRLANQAREDDVEDYKSRERELERRIEASEHRASTAESELHNVSFQHRQEAEKLRALVGEWKHFHNSTMQTTKLAHEKAVEKTRTDVEAYYNGYIQKERKAQSDVIRMKDGEIETRDKAINQLEELVAKERSEHQNIIRDREAKYRADIAHLRATLLGQMEEQKQAYERELADAATEAAEMKLDLENRATLLKQAYEKEIARLKTEHAQVITKMEEEHADELVMAVRELKQKITAMNAILFARDGFAPVPDRLLKEKFLSLRHDVQYLSRQSWREDQPFWTTEVLEGITTNPDKVREQILRDQLWWILIDHVFASPFRMFGDEARTLEGQWNSGCGKDPDLRTGDFVWPQPSFEAEKFRYEAIKQCQSALKEPASHLDPRAKVRKGFIQSRERLSNALRDAISSVAEADQVVFTDVDKLVKKVIGLWLEFELQRCRLMILMPTSGFNSDEDKLALAKEHRLELTSLPALIRFGDDEGQDLDVRQTVGSCSEEVVRVS